LLMRRSSSSSLRATSSSAMFYSTANFVPVPQRVFFAIQNLAPSGFFVNFTGQKLVLAVFCSEPPVPGPRLTGVEISEPPAPGPWTSSATNGPAYPPFFYHAFIRRTRDHAYNLWVH
jgi:hypothetical protein